MIFRAGALALTCATLIVSSCVASPTRGGDGAGTDLSRFAPTGACPRPAPSPLPIAAGASTDLPPEVRAVLEDVEGLRGLRAASPIPAVGLPRDEVAAGIGEAFDSMYPGELYDRRSVAWATIGVIPEGTNFVEEISAFEGAVLGYYDTLTDHLVFARDGGITGRELPTIAHEFVHALEDQAFGLERLDAMLAACDDEGVMAALALVEGSAQHFEQRFVLERMSDEDRAELDDGYDGGAPLASVDPFILAQLYWPYEAGARFVRTIIERRGMAALDAAFADLPTSTEQILHPARYPDDVPTEVVMPDLAAAMGAGWFDLDTMEVGEQWLRHLLRTGLPFDPRGAAAGWDGGRYLAVTDGTSVAVLLRTVWDSPAQAAGFERAMLRWLDRRGVVGAVVRSEGSEVAVAFASAQDLLPAIAAVA